MSNVEVRDPCDGSDGISFNPQRLAQLGRTVVGDQTVQEFCQKTSLSRSLVSRLLNGSLKAPPRIRSIYRFAGENSQIADEMLMACGYPASAVAHMRKTPALLREAEQDSSVPYAPFLADSLTSGLTLMLNVLTQQNYGDRFQIDYRSDGTFAINNIANHTLVGIPAFCSDEAQADNVWRQALHNFAMALRRWNSPGICYILLTNTSQIYTKLKATPNLDYKLAALFTQNGQDFLAQNVIAPHGASEDKMGDYVKDFPIWFVSSSENSL